MTVNQIGAFTAPEYLAATRRDGLRLIELAGSNLSARIPTCPEWDAAALLRHMGEVYNWITNMVERRADAPTAADSELDYPSAGDEVAWCTKLLERAIDVLTPVEASEPMWTWTRQATAGFYHRRLAHETAVHLADMQRGADVPVEIDSDMAADGIDEFVELVFLRPRPADDGPSFPTESLHLHRTDGEGEWMFSTVDGAVQVTHEHGKGDAAIRGSGPDLLLYLWGRGISPACEVFGDGSVAEAWAALAS